MMFLEASARVDISREDKLTQGQFDFVESGRARSAKKTSRLRPAKAQSKKSTFVFQILLAKDVPRGWSYRQVEYGKTEAQAKAILVRKIHKALGRTDPIKIRP